MPKRMQWIHGPWIDLGVFAFSWLPFYLASVASTSLRGLPVCDFHNLSRSGPFMIGMVAFGNYMLRLHRHYTFGVVYTDPDERARYPRLYHALPPILFAVMLPFALGKLFPDPWRGRLYGGLLFFTGVSAVWTIYHPVMQKYGMMRIYAAKLGYGDAAVERGMFLSWTAVVAAILVGGYSRVAVHQARYWLGLDIAWAQPLLALVPYLVVLVAPVALWYSWRFAKLERANYSRASVPRLVFAFSSVVMLATFLHSLLIGYMAAQVNHALEYIAFVNIYAPRKPGLKWWARWPLAANAVVILFVWGFFALLWNTDRVAKDLVVGYTAYSAFLHFIFDTVLWKLRDRPRREAILSFDQKLDIVQKPA